MGMDEVKLVAALKGRDSAAIEALIETHGNRLLRSATLLCGDETNAQDLVQDAFVEALRSVHRFRGQASLYTWLHAILMNLTRHYRRDSQRLVYDNELVAQEVSVLEERPSALAFESAAAELARALRQLSVHLTFYSRATGQGFGGVYFGQGQWVLRHKQWSYRDSASRPEKPDVREPLSSAGPNQVLYEYLGNPVAPPENMDAAYTKEGLTRAMRAAAQNAGITLVKIEIDDSEFPFLVGVVFTKRGDRQKLNEQIGKMAAYNYTGGVGGEDSRTMNLVPNSAFPAEAKQRIYRRIMLREQMLFDKMNRGQ